MCELARLVAQGYDHIADAYLARFGSSAVRRKWLAHLVSSLPSTGARVLDLGCGAGIPVAQVLAAQGHHVIGVDLSAEQLNRARRNVPGATFLNADMRTLALPDASLDAVAAFYCLTRLPAADQAPMLAQIARWLRPGGVLVASLGTGESHEWTGSWLGTTMFFAHAGEATLLEALSPAGLALRHSQTDQQDDEAAGFLWIVAVRQHETEALAQSPAREGRPTSDGRSGQAGR